AAQLLDALVDRADDEGLAFLTEVCWDRLPLTVPAARQPLPKPVPLTPATADRLLADVGPVGGRLRFVEFRTDRRPGEPDETVLHLDVRSVTNNRDTIVVVVLRGPHGCSPLTVTPDGLALVARPECEFTADGISLTLPLSGGTWTGHAAAGTWYAD
ncbi:MAG TPA: hypothetical protein VGD43_17510, partial [Micromonospora sp.]